MLDLPARDRETERQGDGRIGRQSHSGRQAGRHREDIDLMQRMKVTHGAGEVNADVRRYVKLSSGAAFGLSSEKWMLSSVNTTDVGRKMLTKALGSWDDEDLVDR